MDVDQYLSRRSRNDEEEEEEEEEEAKNLIADITCCLRPRSRPRHIATKRRSDSERLQNCSARSNTKI